MTDSRCLSTLRIRAAALFLAAAALAVVALVANTSFQASFGSSGWSQALLAMIGFAIDVLALVLPAVAGVFWLRRHYGSAVFAYAVWVVAI